MRKMNDNIQAVHRRRGDGRSERSARAACSRGRGRQRLRPWVTDSRRPASARPATVRLPVHSVAAGLARVFRRWALPSLVAFTAASLAPAAPPDARAEVYEMGDRRELFVDRHRIESMTGSARLALHAPQPAEIALKFDAPWEGPPSTYVTVLRDGDKVRMYYRGYWAPPGSGEKGTGRTQLATRNDGRQFACMAESTDGKTFTKPKLGLYEFQGSKENNIVLPHRSHNFAPFVDQRPGVPADQRYKALMQKSSDSALGKEITGGGLAAFYSPDGIHWRVAINRTVQTGGGYDSHNVAFWDPNHNEYRAYSRVYPNRVRGIGWPRSSDFLSFTEREQIVIDGKPNAPLTAVAAAPGREDAAQAINADAGKGEHFYTNATVLYMRAPHMYLSFPMRYVPSRSGLKGHDSTSDAVFLSSRDGTNFDRTFQEAVIRPGRDPLNWGDRNTMPAHGLIQTGPDEMSIYYTQHYKYPSAHVRRAVWRLDGIASLHADGLPGEMITKPFRFTGRTLTLNYATSAAGTIQIEIQDANGKALPGFTLAEGTKLFGDKIDEPYTWKTQREVSTLAGKTVRLRVALRDADVYSYRFAE